MARTRIALVALPRLLGELIGALLPAGHATIVAALDAADLVVVTAGHLSEAALDDLSATVAVLVVAADGSAAAFYDHGRRECLLELTPDALAQIVRGR